MYLVMLALFSNGAFGGNNRNANIDAQLASMQNQINDNNNNAFAHDLANTGHSTADIMVIAKHFWFHDDDMGDNCHKVYWYFEDWIFD